VDGYSSPRAKKLVLQVSKARLFIGVQKARMGGNVVYRVEITCMICKYNEIFVFRLKINHE
jgi:hypothetical protein